MSLYTLTPDGPTDAPLAIRRDECEVIFTFAKSDFDAALDCLDRLRNPHKYDHEEGDDGV
jgi:hypothetical protein